MLNRFSIFNNAEPTKSSYFSMLLNSTGWFNPFNMSSATARRLFYLTYLASNACLTDGIACMIDDGTNQVYALVCGSYNNQTMTPEEAMYINALPCPIDQFQGCNVIYQFQYNHALYLGQGIFGGYRCALYSFDELRIDSCVPDSLNDLLPKKYGTPQDIVATTGLSVLGAGIVGTVAAGCYSLFNRYRQQDTPLAIETTEESALKLHTAL